MGQTLKSGQNGSKELTSLRIQRFLDGTMSRNFCDRQIFNILPGGIVSSVNNIKNPGVWRLMTDLQKVFPVLQPPTSCG